MQNSSLMAQIRVPYHCSVYAELEDESAGKTFASQAERP